MNLSTFLILSNLFSETVYVFVISQFFEILRKKIAEIKENSYTELLWNAYVYNANFVFGRTQI